MPCHTHKSDGTTRKAKQLSRRTLFMNYNGAEGLGYRGGNTKVDPIVATGTLITTLKIFRYLTIAKHCQKIAG